MRRNGPARDVGGNGLRPIYMVPTMTITWEMLRQAVTIYLECAYPGGQIPSVVQKRLVWDEQRPILEALCAPPFESYTAKAPHPCTVHALRLGSTDYPNLKLEIRPFPCKQGFMFWVNTHDEFFTISPTMPDAEQWGQIVRRNRELKQAAERGWLSHKLPTFTSTMQDQLSDSYT